MKKRLSIGLIGLVLFMAGCSNELIVNATNVFSEKETINPHLYGMSIEPKNLDKEEIMQKNLIQSKVTPESEQKIHTEAVDKPPVELKTKQEPTKTDKTVENPPAKTAPKARKKTQIKDSKIDIAKQNLKTTSKKTTKTTQPTKTPAPIKKTSIATIDLLLPQKNSEERTTPITHIVVHFSSNAAKKPKDPYNAKDIHKIFVDYGVSTHYMVGREGEIYLLVPENRVAYHAGKGNLQNFPHYKDELNKHSIGIEMMAIGTKDEMSSMISANTYDQIPEEHIGYTEAQYQSLQKLMNDLIHRNPTIKRDRQHIVGHDEYAPNRKSDPGSLFDWSRIGF